MKTYFKIFTFLIDSKFIGFKAGNLAIACLLELFSQYGFNDGREEALKLVSKGFGLDLEEILRASDIMGLDQMQNYKNEKKKIMEIV